MMSEKSLLNLIKTEGIDKIIFHVPMRPLHVIPGFVSYTTSSDNEIEVPCKIDTSRYDPFEGYKITLKSMFKNFGHEHFYVSDLVSLIERGRISIRGMLKTA